MEYAHPSGLLRLTGLPKRKSVPQKNISNAESAPDGGNDKPRPDTDAFYFHQWCYFIPGGWHHWPVATDDRAGSTGST